MRRQTNTIDNKNDLWGYYIDNSKVKQQVGFSAEKYPPKIKTTTDSITLFRSTLDSLWVISFNFLQIELPWKKYAILAELPYQEGDPNTYTN